MGKIVKKEDKLNDRKNPARIHFISRFWKILGILVLISALGGCVGREIGLGSGFSTQNADGDNVTLSQNAQQNVSTGVNESKPNQVRLILRPSELNRSGKLPVTLKITNPKLNETVVTLFRPQFGQEWYNQTNITYVTNRSWTQSFSIKPKGNISYVQVFVQISADGTVVKKAAFNITLGVPVEKAK